MSSERRAQPRYVVDFPVQMRIHEGEPAYDGLALNVSRNALEADFDTDAVKSLQVQSPYPHSCEIEFRLPGLNEDVRVPCQLLRFRRLSQHRYRIVLGFHEVLAVSLTDLPHFDRGHPSCPGPSELPDTVPKDAT